MTHTLAYCGAMQRARLQSRTSGSFGWFWLEDSEIAATGDWGLDWELEGWAPGDWSGRLETGDWELEGCAQQRTKGHRTRSRKDCTRYVGTGDCRVNYWGLETLESWKASLLE